jgi:pyruvate formate-lyase activating enzyme-like uncharacterized protein
MKLITIQEALSRKFERQRNLDALEYHASGHCVHIGKLSPGCQKCFVPDDFSCNILCGIECNLNCAYCPVRKEENPYREIFFQKMQTRLYQCATTQDLSYTIPSVAFSGEGDPLMHLNVIVDFMRFLKGLEKYMKKRPWYYIYTNGLRADLDLILRLKDLGFDEIRFHTGASNFSKKVYKNMALAMKHLNTVTVETPAWPPHRLKLFEMLPIMQDTGVKHLNMGEVEITQENYGRISKVLPDAEIYQCHGLNLYDGGLTYDLIEEILKKNYSYSVLDCNCLTKMIQRAPGKKVYYENVDRLCAKYDT